jgi:hypothetical protein
MNAWDSRSAMRAKTAVVVDPARTFIACREIGAIHGPGECAFETDDKLGTEVDHRHGRARDHS